MSESKHTRNYRFSRDELCYEDELPEDMTDEDYHEWFIKSYVDIVRIGPKPSRIGPTEPDDTMVICPVCTSQYRAIPLDVQRQLAFLSAPERRSAHSVGIGERERSPMKHTCHWPGCPKEVPPAMWGCREHWFKLPKPLRDAVWRSYVPGQEITKTPSPKYLAVAAIVQGWIAGKVTVNRDGSIVVHEDIPVRGLSVGKTAAKGNE